MFHILKVNATLKPRRISKRMQFHGDEMQRARDGQGHILPEIIGSTPGMSEGSLSANIRSTGKAAAGYRREAKPDEIRATMKNRVAVSGKERNPAFCVRVAHKQIDIESGARVGQQVDGVTAGAEVNRVLPHPRSQGKCCSEPGVRTELRSV